MNTSNRKLDHIRICLEEEVESSYTGFEDIMLVHNALPEVDFEEIDTSVEMFGKKLSAPFIIASMTGGHPDTKEINRNLAIAVEELGLGMGVGSQRAAIEDEKLADSFTVVRDAAPNAFIYANVGVAQVKQSIEFVEKAVEMIDADAVAIHLNFLQEVIQPEGDVDAKGCIEAIKEVCEAVKVPVIVKETGAGISRSVALKLKEVGVEAIDVGGKGGTSWSGVEVYRTSDIIAKNVGLDFWDWGIPTAFSVVECGDVLPTIATGGIRSGLDAAKAIAIGAFAASAALPFLRPATQSAEEVKLELEYFLHGLKVAMFLTGCQKIEELRKAELCVFGKFKEWLELRGINTREFCLKRQGRS
ncbi:type 2 isopentenyl-diphosphate Delta-isomerase [Archaeoglobus veneficus]|uniref:Isopentenyl-diphosphate delta-isomerase n=1 Tax=Archaeoglobus veneficus (strain DSM 11195 / SNP6) TaxID=693661 RepID=F2KQR0_ARCVS|nr:type 2 isopentenyl-diphosphate Delta-isomerase [Archaeoglobus veneficus]AEA46622.1 Isopentenyl-diphosphate delta-isomerase [Archaeoglobus veneficus SNP6]